MELIIIALIIVVLFILRDANKSSKDIDNLIKAFDQQIDINNSTREYFEKINKEIEDIKAKEWV